MATEIVLKEAELADIAQKAIALDASMSNINRKLQSLYSQLDNDIVMIQKAGTHITYGLPEISKNIQKQSSDMASISQIMSAAGEKAVSTNQSLIGQVGGVKEMSLNMGTVATVAGVGAAIGVATGNFFGVNGDSGSWTKSIVSSIFNRVDYFFDKVGNGAQELLEWKRLNDIFEQSPNAKYYYNELLAKGYSKETLYNMMKDNPANAEVILKQQCYNDTINYIKQRDQKFISSKQEWERIGRTTNAYGPYNADGSANCRAITLLKMRELGLNTNGKGWGPTNTLKNNGFAVNESRSLRSVIEQYRVEGQPSSVQNIVVLWQGHAMLIDEVRFDCNGEALVFMSDNDNYSDVINVGGYAGSKNAINKNPWTLDECIQRYDVHDGHRNEKFTYSVLGSQESINARLGR